MEEFLRRIEDILDAVEEMCEDDDRMRGHEPVARFVVFASGGGRVEALTPDGALTLVRWKGNRPGSCDFALRELEERLGVSET